MEEVDSIILHFLRQLSVNIPDDTKGLSNLSPDNIAGAVSVCLNTINPALKAPKVLPAGISHRIEVAAQLATMCKDLGYQSEVGYQTFLYKNEDELRRVLMFLIESLPTVQDKPVSPVESEDFNSLLWENIRKKITEELHSIWVPHCRKADSRKIGMWSFGCTGNSQNVEKQLQNDATLLEKLKKVKEIEMDSIKPHKSVPSYKINTEIPSPNVLNPPSVGAVVKPVVPQVNLRVLKEEGIVLRENLNALMAEKKVLDRELLQIKMENELLDTEIRNLESINNLMTDLGIGKTEGLETITSKLAKELNKLHMKSDQCTQRNLTLKAEIETLKRDLAQCHSERNRRLKTLEGLKATARELKENYRLKEQSNIQLRKEYEKLNRTGIKRSFYTKKIMEIIGNVAKQNTEIQKILGDTRQLQKEINNVNGQLDRSFSIADETLFRDAKKDDQSKKAYKLLALLHSECNAIVSLVNETGTMSREIVDLEDHIEVEKSKRTEETLHKVQYDLIQIQKEIETLHNAQ